MFSDVIGHVMLNKLDIDSCNIFCNIVWSFLPPIVFDISHYLWYKRKNSRFCSPIANIALDGTILGFHEAFMKSCGNLTPCDTVNLT